MVEGVGNGLMILIGAIGFGILMLILYAAGNTAENVTDDTVNIACINIPGISDEDCGDLIIEQVDE